MCMQGEHRLGDFKAATVYLSSTHLSLQLQHLPFVSARQVARCCAPAQLAHIG